jgi:hypothetical protein
VLVGHATGCRRARMGGFHAAETALAELSNGHRTTVIDD